MISAGKSVTLTCDVDSVNQDFIPDNHKLSFKWSKEGDPSFKKRVGNSITIDPFQDADVGRYRCKVTFKCSCKHWASHQKQSYIYELKIQGEYL